MGLHWASSAAEAAWHYACDSETWWTAATAYGASHICRAEPQLSPRQQAWQDESLRFHSAIVDIEWVNGEKAEMDLRIADTALANNCAQVPRNCREGDASETFSCLAALMSGTD